MPTGTQSKEHSIPTRLQMDSTYAIDRLVDNTTTSLASHTIEESSQNVDSNEVALKFINNKAQHAIPGDGQVASTSSQKTPGGGISVDPDSAISASSRIANKPENSKIRHFGFNKAVPRGFAEYPSMGGWNQNRPKYYL